MIPTRAQDSGIAAVFKPLFPLFPPDALDSMKHSGMFALSQPGALDELLTATGLQVHADEEIDCPVVFSDADTAARAFIGAGPMQLAIEHAGEQAITETLMDTFVAFTGADGQISLPAGYRVVLARTPERRPTRNRTPKQEAEAVGY